MKKRRRVRRNKLFKAFCRRNWQGIPMVVAKNKPKKIFITINPAEQIVPDTDSPRKMIKWLCKKQFKILGQGFYTTVLGKPDSDRVIRVTRSNDNWIDYVQWAAKNGYAGNFAPRVYSWKNHGTWSVSIAERMAGTVDHDDEDYALLCSFYWRAIRGHVLSQLYMEDLAPGSTKFFKEMHDKFSASDICGRNIMVRKDGTFCLTDPVCGRIVTTSKRLRSADFSASPVYELLHGMV